MFDNIGLGSAIANVTYLFIILVGILGIWFFLKKKIILGVIFWISATLNFITYLYFMGNYRFYEKFLYIAVNKYWLLVNALLFILLIIKLTKNAKTKNFIHRN